MVGFILKTEALAQAWKLLTEFTKRDARGTAMELRDSAQKRVKIREAIITAATHPWPEAEWNPAMNKHILMGILASDVRVAVRALRDWTTALGVEYFTPISRVCAVLLFKPKYLLSLPEDYLFLLSKRIFSGSKYPIKTFI